MSDTTIYLLLIGGAVVFFLWLRSFIRRRGQNFPNLQHAFGVRNQRRHDDHTPHDYVLPAAIATGYVAANSQAQSNENTTSNDIGTSGDSIGASSDSGSSGGDSTGGGDGGGGGGGGD